MYIVVKNIDVVNMDAGSCILVGAADTVAVGTVALTDLVDSAHTVVLPAGLVELAGTAASVALVVVADNGVLGNVDYAEIVVQDSLVVVAELGFAVFDNVVSAGTAVVADTVDLVRSVEVVDNAELAAGTADFVVATEWQPFLIVLVPRPCKKVGEAPQNMKTPVKELKTPKDKVLGVVEKSSFSDDNESEIFAARRVKEAIYMCDL